jgi:hypothetical protein
MSIEDSSKLIKEIADRREADDYFEGLLKDPAMRADMERTEREVDQPHHANQAINDVVSSQPTIWEEAAQDLGKMPCPELSQETEMER